MARNTDKIVKQTRAKYDARVLQCDVSYEIQLYQDVRQLVLRPLCIVELYSVFYVYGSVHHNIFNE